MHGDHDLDPALERARRRGRRVGNVALIAIVSVFVGLAAWEIGRAALGGGKALDASAASPLQQGSACAGELRELVWAIGRGRREADNAGGEESAREKFSGALTPEWEREGEIRVTCGKETHGTDAMAAVLRLRRLEEVFVRKRASEVVRARRAAEAYLPDLPEEL